MCHARMQSKSGPKRSEMQGGLLARDPANPPWATPAFLPVVSSPPENVKRPAHEVEGLAPGLRVLHGGGHDAWVCRCAAE